MPNQSGQQSRSKIPLEARIYKVSELNREAKLTLEDGLKTIWIDGEISNLARPGSGHLYFSLKDAEAQVRCAMFRGANQSLRFIPQDGLQVILRARVTIYEARGSYQLIVEHMEPAGEGLLRRQFEELKAKLAAEGLFDTTEKLTLPTLPRRIGIITSPTGAAVRDILHILARRFPAVPVIIYPVQVQGEQAKHDITQALETAATRSECDVLVVARGGGSLEDLWAFNEEMVARAVSACPIPIISAVGHEVDFTMTDLVADLRAPTPSGAAELVVPDRKTWLDRVTTLQSRARNTIAQAANRHREQITRLDGRLQRRNPVLLLEQYAQRLDELAGRIGRALHQRIRMDRLRLRNAVLRIRAGNPLTLIREQRQVLAGQSRQLSNAIRHVTEAEHQRLAVLAARLQTISPLDTLKRGYTIVENPQGQPVRSTQDIKEKDRITGRLTDGSFRATVNKILPD
ncbi:MAG TPA: exodeoxyribonuclease VII large subunit [Gammaproteobacteria bacterium]|jgi:exodeoxyribonuclease VII large subunit|nr:exodeoxyribonuclease VII large subunit [Gammaproteobacteria bacterium]MDP7152814.1 exodeoxyribonuclease VII large subunit [Gammaproteobacteria bacterium]MDP7297058.1 exodeoxyribonuclease VII large subunit [Gammaproteobacteria bacterium]MDP7660684.1 exodeoxyribonuclease VII large subunit [Gammaproteobacteria bacterium]HJP39040.1 exodeoxyribonuclease VII large subunit [Gammaproteobacteria bacterium]